ncbi:MAG TPA: hypothetical protein VGK19_12675 [Capsulimonadaceae bacterium]|jgi:poly(3-hydroxybutyrate) depolymerase
MNTIKAIVAVATLALLSYATTISRAADWPPTIDAANSVTQAVDGRTIERYVHGARPTWGYPETAAAEWIPAPGQESGPTQQNHNSFYVVMPKTPRENAPLMVVLHSANRTAYDYMGYECLDRRVDKGDDPATAMTNYPSDFYGLYLNSTNSEWWGWSQARANIGKQVSPSPPAELRVMDTIDWIASRYKIDRDRIYLCGVSMGGCGTLGIGLHHGDVFAAIRAEVPAGTGYANYSMGGFAPSPAPTAGPEDRAAWLKRASAAGLPDPPVLVDFSSQSDTWATTQPALVQAAEYGRLPLVLCWGTFGHTTFSSPIARTPQGEIALAFPWLEIRKNEAYPVFSRASCNDRSPWLDAPADYDNAGQSNAYLRWKSDLDTPSKFAMQLWLAHPQIKNAPFTMPDSATADVTVRRFQQFKTRDRGTYNWKFVRDNKVVASGRISPDATKLLTIPRLPITTLPAALQIESLP